MADDKVRIARSKLIALGEAIRTKTGSTDEYRLTDIPAITTEIVNKLTSITFTLPTKDYTAGDALDLTGMSVIAHYSYASDNDVTSVATISPTGGSPLVVGNNTITASYTEKGITKTASVVVNANEPGTYDASDNLLKSWDELIADGDVVVTNGELTTPSDRYTRFASAKSIRISDSVMSIGVKAFYTCAALTSITIPDSVTSIGKDAFQNCAGLTSIKIPNSVTSFGRNAFTSCTALTSITIPNSVTSISEGMFYDCPNLTSITIPDSVTDIGEYGFGNCESLTSITIPDSVTSIATNAFYNCTNLTTIHYSGTATGAPWNAPNATVVP